MSVVKKKNSRNVTVALVTINATFNNTIVTFADLNGNVLTWSSAGKCGFKGAKKSTPYAASVAVQDAAIRAISEWAVKTVSVVLKGPGSGRESAIQALSQYFKITVLKDGTGLPHNGCRPPSKRRV